MLLRLAPDQHPGGLLRTRQSPSLIRPIVSFTQCDFDLCPEPQRGLDVHYLQHVKQDELAYRHMAQEPTITVYVPKGFLVTVQEGSTWRLQEVTNVHESLIYIQL